MRSGSLFSGYGGLDMAISQVFGAEPAWFSEIDDTPSKILAHHWPDVPNHGDITQIDWASVEPIGILTGGFPCQDVSLAGKRAGMKPDTRSGLWTHMAYAIKQLRPRYVVAENVRGLLSADAHSDLEPCPWCLGDGHSEPPLRALGAVLADLADLGYDASWCGLRAADVGATHGRFRVFVLARDAQVLGRDDARPALRGGQPAWPAGGSGIAAADSPSRGADAAQQPRLAQRAVAGGNTLADASCERVEGWHESDGPRTTGLGWSPDGRTTANADGHALRQQPVTQPRSSDSAVAGLIGADPAGRGASAALWGQYAGAIQRWELILGRPAPAPTEATAKGSQRLSPRFVEWMMGLPAGHVTDVPGVNRNGQLKALGNGVVPQQAAAALRHMLSAWEVAA